MVWDDSEYFVDIITIQNIKGQEDINRFVEGKINDKFDKKTFNLQDEGIFNHFRVLPIIEFEDDRLLDYNPSLPEDKAFPPMLSLLENIDEDKYISLQQLPLREDIKEQLNNKLQL